MENSMCAVLFQMMLLLMTIVVFSLLVAKILEEPLFQKTKKDKYKITRTADLAISKTLTQKKNFNASQFIKW